MSIKSLVNNPDAKFDKSLNLNCNSLDCEALQVAGQAINPSNIIEDYGTLNPASLNFTITSGSLGSGDVTYIRTGHQVTLFFNLTVNQTASTTFFMEFDAPFMVLNNPIPSIHTNGAFYMGSNLWVPTLSLYTANTNRIGMNFVTVGAVSGTATIRASLVYNITTPPP